MANLSSHIDLLTVGQSGKEYTVNDYFNASSPASAFGRRQATSSYLTWGYYGATMMIGGVMTQIANGILTLTPSATNYVEVSSSGVVSKNTVGFTAGSTPLYQIVCGASSITTFTDRRAFVLQAGYAGAAQAAVSGTPTVSELAVLANALRDALVRSGIIKGSA